MTRDPCHAFRNAGALSTSRFREPHLDCILNFGIPAHRVPATHGWYGTCCLPWSCKLREIIGHCAGIERTIAEIYASFAEASFAERWPQLPFGDLWRELANEELVHGALLDNAARLPAAKREEASVDASKLKAIRDRVVKRFPTLGTTLDQAFHTALDLEELELDNIYRRLLAVTTDDSRMSSTFRTALGQYGHHQERLVAAIEEHGKDPSLLERATRARRRLLHRSAAENTVGVTKA